MKFRKKPVVIDAWVWDETETTLKELRFQGMEWCGYEGHRDRPGWVGNLRIKTLESGDGSFRVSIGDYIIKGVRGEFYACKPDIFAATYEAVPPPSETAKPVHPDGTCPASQACACPPPSDSQGGKPCPCTVIKEALGQDFKHYPNCPEVQP